MGAPSPEPPSDTEPQRPNAAPRPEEPRPAQAQSPQDGEEFAFPPRPGADASDRVVRYLMGPTAFCA
jgi:hypothetical protein